MQTIATPAESLTANNNDVVPAPAPAPARALAIALARKLLTRGINLEWMLNELYRNSEWLAMVPDGPSKLALRDEIEQILRGVTL